MTIEEIKQAVQNNPNLAKEIAVWSTGETEAGKEILTNFAKAEVEKKIKENTAEIYTNIDNDLFEVLGVRKANDQKTYEFLKKIAGEYKELKGKAEKLNDNERIKELEAKIKKMQDEGSVNEHWKKIYDEAVSKWQTEKQTLSDQITAKEKEFLEAQIEADLKAGLGSLKLKADIPKNVIDALIQVEKDKIVKGAKVIDGKVVYHQEDGTPRLNKEYKPITSNEIWSDTLGSLIETNEPPKGGGGANPKLPAGRVEKTGEGDNAKIKLVLDKGSFSTKVEFNNKADELLRKQGVAVGSKDYQEAIMDAYKEYEVDKLEMQ